jgi:hypothetical protein
MSRVLTNVLVLTNFSYLEAAFLVTSEATQPKGPVRRRHTNQPPRHGRAREPWDPPGSKPPPYNIQRVGVVYQTSPPGRRSWATASLLPPTGAGTHGFHASRECPPAKIRSNQKWIPEKERGTPFPRHFRPSDFPRSRACLPGWVLGAGAAGREHRWPRRSPALESLLCGEYSPTILPQLHDSASSCVFPLLVAVRIFGAWSDCCLAWFFGWLQSSIDKISGIAGSNCSSSPQNRPQRFIVNLFLVIFCGIGLTRFRWRAWLLKAEAVKLQCCHWPFWDV